MSPSRQQTEDWRTAFAESADAVRGGEDCPPAERLWESAEGKLRGRDAEAIVLHLGECGSCAAAWRLARELAPPVVTTSRPESAAGFSIWHWVPAAALVSLTLVATIGILRPPDWPGHDPGYRATQNEWLRPAVDAEQPLARRQALLTWSAGPPGTTYDLRVTTESLDLVYTDRHLERPEATIPPGALEGIPQHGQVLWQVTAHLPDGTEVNSRTFITPLE
jgi:hypothetical protein